jgi:Ran GTPase-activating protein (RanGAP) involved in mRNA processing and transport
MTGLIKNNTITHLDVSHNKITNHGARLLSKLLGENSVMCTLNVADNHIHTEGGRYFARGLRENDALLELNLRLNHLGDDGCRLLLEGLQDNLTLTNLNLSSNYAQEQATHTICSIIRDSDHNMSAIDMSGNLLSEEMIDEIDVAMRKNKSLVSVDLRRNPGFKSDSESIQNIEKILHDNDYHLRK